MKLQDSIVVYAVRYALGRMSTAPSDVCDWLLANWQHLHETTRTVIQRDIEREFERDDEQRAEEPDACQSSRPLGWDCDRYTWERVRALWEKEQP